MSGDSADEAKKGRHSLVSPNAEFWTNRRKSNFADLGATSIPAHIRKVKPAADAMDVLAPVAEIPSTRNSTEKHRSLASLHASSSMPVLSSTEQEQAADDDTDGGSESSSKQDFARTTTFDDANRLSRHRSRTQQERADKQSGKVVAPPGMHRPRSKSLSSGLFAERKRLTSVSHINNLPKGKRMPKMTREDLLAMFEAAKKEKAETETNGGKAKDVQKNRAKRLSGRASMGGVPKGQPISKETPDDSSPVAETAEASTDSDSSDTEDHKTKLRHPNKVNALTSVLASMPKTRRRVSNASSSVVKERIKKRTSTRGSNASRGSTQSNASVEEKDETPALKHDDKDSENEQTLESSTSGVGDAERKEEDKPNGLLAQLKAIKDNEKRNGGSLAAPSGEARVASAPQLSPKKTTPEDLIPPAGNVVADDTPAAKTSSATPTGAEAVTPGGPVVQELLCDNCFEGVAKKRCLECRTNLCVICSTRLHTDVTIKDHDRLDLHVYLQRRQQEREELIQASHSQPDLRSAPSQAADQRKSKSSTSRSAGAEAQPQKTDQPSEGCCVIL